MSARPDLLSRHVDCDDLRHYAFARTCPGFHPPRRNPDLPVWIAVCVACLFIVGYVALANLGVIAP